MAEMSPDHALYLLRASLSVLQRQYDRWGTYDEMNVGDLIQDIKYLDKWLSNGGDAPAEWCSDPIARYAARAAAEKAEKARPPRPPRANSLVESYVRNAIEGKD